MTQKISAHPIDPEFSTAVFALNNFASKLNASSVLNPKQAQTNNLSEVDSGIRRLLKTHVAFCQRGLVEVQRRIAAVREYTTVDDIEIACIGIHVRIQTIFFSILIPPTPKQCDNWDRLIKAAFEKAQGSNGAFDLENFKKAIIAHRLNVHVGQYGRLSLLEIAFFLRDPGLVSLLVQAGADVDTFSFRQETRMERLSTVAMRLLVNQFSLRQIEADSKEVDASCTVARIRWGRISPRDSESELNIQKIIYKILLKAGADSNLIIEFNGVQACLSMYFHDMSVQMVQFVIDEGLDVNKTFDDPEVSSPLAAVLWHRRFDIAKILVFNGALLNPLNQSMHDLWGVKYAYHRNIYLNIIDHVHRFVFKTLILCLDGSERIVPGPLIALILSLYDSCKGPIPSEIACIAEIETRRRAVSEVIAPMLLQQIATRQPSSAVCSVQ